MISSATLTAPTSYCEPGLNCNTHRVCVVFVEFCGTLTIAVILLYYYYYYYSGASGCTISCNVGSQVLYYYYYYVHGASGCTIPCIYVGSQVLSNGGAVPRRCTQIKIKL